MARTNFKVFDIREVGCRLNQMRLKELTLENDLVFHESASSRPPCPKSPLLGIPMDGVNAGMFYGRATDTLAVVWHIDIVKLYGGVLSFRACQGKVASSERNIFDIVRGPTASAAPVGRFLCCKVIKGNSPAAIPAYSDMSPTLVDYALDIIYAVPILPKLRRIKLHGPDGSSF